MSTDILLLLWSTILFWSSGNCQDVYDYKVLPPVYNVDAIPPVPVIHPQARDIFTQTNLTIEAVQNLITKQPTPIRKTKHRPNVIKVNSIFHPVLPLEPHSKLPTEADPSPGKFGKKGHGLKSSLGPHKELFKTTPTTPRIYRRPPKAKPESGEVTPGLKKILDRPLYRRPGLAHPLNLQNENGIENDESLKKYFFDYKVEDRYSGQDFGHSESSDGEVVRGAYRVRQANGKVQKVEYSVEGDTGLLLTYV